jgi:hypothetical protein
VDEWEERQEDLEHKGKHEILLLLPSPLTKVHDFVMWSQSSLWISCGIFGVVTLYGRRVGYKIPQR